MDAVQVPSSFIDLIWYKPQDAFQRKISIVLGISPSRHEKGNNSHSLCDSNKVYVTE